MPEPEQRVRRVDDSWIEVPAEASDGSGFGIGPVQLRPGADDDTLILSEVPAIGAEIKIRDLREGVDLIEREAA